MAMPTMFSNERRYYPKLYKDLPRSRVNTRAYSFAPRTSIQIGQPPPPQPRLLRGYEGNREAYISPPPPPPQRYDIQQHYEGSYTPVPYYRSRNIEDNRHTLRPSCRTLRSTRGPPAPSGIVTNNVRLSDIATDMYYTPNEAKDPAVSSDRKTESEFEHRQEDSIPDFSKRDRVSKSKASDDKRRRSRPLHRSTPVVKAVQSSVLPILMWPAGPPTENRGNYNDDTHSSSSSNEKFGLGPPRGPRIVSNSQGDQSMQEILERIYDSMLVGKSSRQDDIFSNMETIFREMEMAHAKDARYTPPEVPNLALNDQGASAVQNKTLSGQSKYGSVRSTSNRVSDPASPEIPEYQARLHEFSSSANRLLEFFIPADYSNPVIGRYYGSIKRIIQVGDPCF
jgi:hypothetical protein